MTTTLKVSEGDACVDCPLYDSDWGACNADETNGVDRPEPFDADGPPPDWCPLKSGDVVVRLVRKGGV